MGSGYRIAITGTPGCGKTTLCTQASDSGMNVEAVAVIAYRYGLLGSPDPDDGAAPIDTDALAKTLAQGEWASETETAILIDGHLSHYLPVDAVVLLRCHPEVLQQRLIERGYSDPKVDENVEAELIGVIAGECLASAASGGNPMLEIDMTAAKTGDVLGLVNAWITDGFKPRLPNAPVDWIELLHGGD
jgi:adenylate kinase